LATAVPDVQEGQGRSEETSVDPAIPTFRRKCWAFDFAVVLDFQSGGTIPFTVSSKNSKRYSKRIGLIIVFDIVFVL
jgi:hypothetical protein